MPNLLQRGATWLGTKLQAAGGRAVVYRRGTKSVAITVVPIERKQKVESDEGLGVELDIYDFKIVASELVLSGEATEPQLGDLMTETLNGHEYEWQVMPPDTESPVWEWFDKATMQHYRVHTKKVKGA
jgi:hypothetical protein